MGIFSRIRDIAASNASDFKEKNENDEKTVEEYITKQMIALADIKKSAAELIKLDKELQAEYEECCNQAERFGELAKKAVAAGNEEDARVFLRRKHELEQKKDALGPRCKEAHENAEKIRLTYNQMVGEIKEMQARLKIIQGREAAADAQNTLNRTISPDSEIDEAFDKLERSADIKAARSEAESYALNDEDELSREIEALKKELGNK